MSLYRTHQDDGLLLGIWKMEETTEALLGMLDNRSWYEEAVNRFPEKRLAEWLAVRVLLNTLCGEEKEVAYYPSGKPYLKDGSRHISISHTRGYVAVALHLSREVGIDIEQYGTKVERVASRFIRQDELPGFWRGSRIYSLLLHWSAKETLFKLIDSTEVDFIGHLRILPFIPSEEGEFKAQEYKTGQRGTFRICYLVHPDFVLTWTVK